MYFSPASDASAPRKSAARATMLATTALIAALSVVPVKTFAQTWDGDTNLNWSLGTNWDTNVAPIATGDVVVAGAGGANQPILTVVATVNSTLVSGGALRIEAGGALTNTAGLTQTGGSVVVNTGGTLIGTAGFSGGTATVNSGATIAGAVTVSGGSLSNAGGIASPITVNSGTFVNTGTTGDLTVAGGVANLNAGSNVGNAASVAVNGGTLIVNTAETVGALSGTGGSILVADKLTFGNATNTVVNAAISGASGIEKLGTGTTELSRNNTFAGETKITGGTLLVSNSGALGSTAGGTTVASNTTLAIQGGINIGAEPLSLRGTGAGGVGAVNNVSGTNSFGGPVTLAIDSLINSTAGSLTFSGAVVNGGNLLSVGGAGDLAFTNTVSGGGGLTKDGAGTLTLSGANTYGGTTTVNAGTLIVSGGAALADAAPVILNGTSNLTLNTSERIGSLTGATGSTVTLGANTLTTGNASNTTMAGAIGGTGGLTKEGTGEFTLSGTNTFTGATTVNGGKLIVTGGAALADTTAVSVGAAGTLALGASETIGSLAGVAGSKVELGGFGLTTGGNNGTTIMAGVISGSGALTKDGTGDMTLSGVNTYTGATTVNAGKLILSGGSALVDNNAVALNGTSNLTLNTSERIGSLTGATGSTVTLGANTLTTGNASNTTMAGAIGGTGGLTKEGTGEFTLSGTNTFTGATTVNAGKLIVSGGAALADTTAVTLNGTSNLTLNTSERIGSLAGAAGSTVTLGANTLTTGDASNTAMAGAISGAGGLTKEGTGEFTLSGTNTYTGATTVNAGKLIVSGGAALADTNAVTLNGTGNLTLASNETIGSLAGVGGTTVALGANRLTLTSGTTTIASVISGIGGGLTIQGTAATTLTAVNTYTGDTNVTAGNLTIAVAASVAGNVNTSGPGATQNDGTISGTETTSGGGAFTNNGGVNAVVHDGGTTTNNGVITTSLDVNANGATNAATGTVNGDVTVDGGTLTNNGTLGDAAADKVTVGATGQLDTNLTVNSEVINDGIVNAKGDVKGKVTNQGSGIFALSGNLAGGGLAFDNTGSARLDVLLGNYTGLGVFTNSSGLAAGVNVGSGMSLTATSFQNNLGSTIALDGGKLVGAVTNNGTIRANGASEITGTLANTGTVTLQDGATDDNLTITGLTTGAGNFALDLNLTSGTADTITASGGIAVVNLQFAATGSGYYLGPITVLTGKTGGTSNLTQTGLPIGGAILYALAVDGGGAVQVTPSVNPAVGGVAAGAAMTQSLIATVVNRPTSPFVSGLAAEETCSHGGFARVSTGIATVGGQTSSNGIISNTSIDTKFSGIQAGYDVGCFDGRFFNGWDGAAGVMLGYNSGSTTQGIFSDPLDNTILTGVSGSKFNQSYIGLYAAGSKDRLSGDVQLRFDSTAFDLSESTVGGYTAIGLNGKSYSTKSTTFGSRLNYRMDVNEEKGINFVPTIGFNYTHTSGDTVGLAAGQTLEIMASDTVVGFVGGTLTKTKISSEGTAATTYFVSGNYYQDFGGDRHALYTDTGLALTAPLAVGSVGGFAEASVGVNYVKILENGPGGAKQLNANIRADTRFGSNVSDSYSLTAQVRLSF